MPCIPIRFLLFMTPLGLLGHEVSLDRPIPSDRSVSPVGVMILSLQNI